jgi:hypothetical protein
MKKYFDRNSIGLACAMLLCSVPALNAQTGDRFGLELEKGFAAPPDSIKTGVYWYWLNDHISKEGVVADLHAMKQAGINRAFIGSNIVSGNHFGKVKIFSDEWYDVLHIAMKTAAELDIEIGLFNCPGWSQSGGPWIKPEQAMRCLASSELHVKGAQRISQKLAQPAGFFQDVKVLAFPVTPEYGRQDFHFGKYSLAAPEETLTVALPETEILRSIAVYPAGYLNASFEVQAKEGGAYRTVSRFDVVRTLFKAEVGFEPYSPVTVALDNVKARELRIIVLRNGDKGSIGDIVLSPTPKVERFAEKTLAKMFEGNLPPWDFYMWREQPPLKSPDYKYVKQSQVQDISRFMAADGTLTWDVPQGDWLILRTGMKLTGVKNSPASPEGTGLEVDKMSRAHVAAHFDGFLGKIMERIPEADRRSWKTVIGDSYETGSQNFTDGFLDEFKQRYGYDATPFLPVFHGHVVGSPDLSDRFLWDIRRMVADKVSYDYVGGLREVSHRHGLTTWLENYGHWGFPGEFLQYGGQSDEIGGEFWDGQSINRYENRIAASCAHIYGKPRVSAESFTSSGPACSRHPADFKGHADWSFTEGVNQTVLHVYIEQPYENDYPGIDAWFGNEFNRKNTWFSQMDLFTLYLKRCNFMLQQGLNVADVAYFIGEDAPKMTGPDTGGDAMNPFGNDAGVARNTAGASYCRLPAGYDYDYVNAEVILRDMTVKDGKLILPHGTAYRMLVLPPQETMRPEVLQKIERLVAAGGVVMGPPPVRSPSLQRYPEADSQVKALAQKLWGDRSARRRAYDKGLILNNMSLEEAFALLKMTPDCMTGKAGILYSHRTLDGREIYFLSNQDDKPVNLNVQFRVKDMQPELWDALTGIVRPLPVFEQTGETTAAPLELDARGSAFIVFREKEKPASAGTQRTASLQNFPQPEILADINTPWTVAFEHDSIHRGASGTVTFTELKDWTQSDDDRIRYYSGTAVYRNSFSIADLPNPSSSYIFLDLGNACAMAKVKINGQYAGGAWTAPYRVNITPFVKEGANDIEIAVVNTWRNRLIGDMQFPEEERIIKSRYSRWNAGSPLQASGLLGPVRVIGFNVK